MTSGRAGGRKKLEPDPQVREELIAAATQLVRANGVRALSIADVLARAGLGTRAFYRHFDSKDQLVSEVFLDMARSEVLRLRRRMSDSTDPVRAVAAWIDGRLDLVVRDEIRSDLRRVSLEAQNQMFAAPELIAPAYREIMRPLVAELGRGSAAGVFIDIDPEGAALSIQGVVWSNTERHWVNPVGDPAVLRERIVVFCLRGLGVEPETISAVVREMLKHNISEKRN